MKVLTWKKLFAAVGLGLGMAALPFTVTAPKAGLDLGVAKACADGGVCCVQYGSVCNGNTNYARFTGGCPPG